MKQVIRYAKHGGKVGGTGHRVRAGWAYGQVSTLEEVSTHETPVLANDIYDQVATPAGRPDPAEVFPGAEPDLTGEKFLPAVRTVTPAADAPVTRGVRVQARVGQRANPLADLSAAFEPGQIPWGKIGVAAALIALFNAVTA